VPSWCVRATVYKFKDLGFIFIPMPRVGSLVYLGFVILLAFAGLALQPRLATAAQATANSQSFETVTANARSAREAGKIDEAIRSYQAGLQLRPKWEEGWWYLGTLLYDTDHFAEAIPALRRVVELDPKAGAGWAFLGLCEFETGDYRDASIHLQRANQAGLGESPDIQKIALYHLGLLLNLGGQFEGATDLLADFGPGPLPEQIKTALGLSLLRVPLLPSQVDPSKDALVHAAGETAALLFNHQLDAASRNFEQMLRDYPGTPYLHYAYGLALVAAAQDDRGALQLHEETLVISREALPWIALANVNSRRKNFAEAVAAAQQAIQLAPRSAAAYEALAQALEGQGKPEQASTASRRALELAKQPGEVNPAQVKRYALSRTTELDRSPPTNAPAPGIQSTPGAVNLEETARLADAARQNGRLDDAAALYQNAVKFRSDWQEGWRQLGTIEYMREHFPQAIVALQQSVAIEAKQPDTWILLGLSEFQTRDYRNSRIHLERGRALGFGGNPGAVRVSRYHLALLRNLEGDFDGAIALLIPEAGPGALADEIQLAMGIALLRIPALPDQMDPSRRAVVHSAGEAAMLLSRSYYDKAFQIFDKMLREYSDIPFLHYAYGDALASASKYDAAQAQLVEETRLNPSNELAYVRLASIALVLHQSGSALEDGRKAVALAPESAEARYVLGRSFLEGGDAPAAIRELEIARRLSPNSPKVHFNLARAYAQANRTMEAEQERAEFERLREQNAKPSSYGDRSTGGSVSDASAQPLAK
jgi:tetratricopeptide (TPR) repeat protein